MQVLWHVDAGYGRPEEELCSCPGQNQARRDAESLDVTDIFWKFGNVLLHVTKTVQNVSSKTDQIPQASEALCIPLTSPNVGLPQSAPPV